jgi:MFS family permease
MGQRVRRLPPAARFVVSARVRLAVGVMTLEFVSAVQMYVTSALLPAIDKDLHARDQLALLVSGAGVGAFISLPLAARVIRRFGLSPVLSASLAGYLVGLTVSVTATSVAVYASGQVLQGAASGMLAVFGLSAVIQFFEPDLRARLLAMTSAMWIAPALVAPPVAVALAGLIGWRVALLLPFPLLVAGRLLSGSAARRRDHDAADAVRYPLMTTLALPAGMALLVAGTSGAPWPIAVTGTGVALVAARTLLPPGTAAPGGDCPPRCRRCCSSASATSAQTVS